MNIRVNNLYIMGGRPPTTVGVRKLESLGYHVALFAWSYVEPSWHNTGPACDRQTDRRTDTLLTYAGQTIMR